MATFGGHRGLVRCLALTSPQQAILASTGDDATVRLSDIATASSSGELRHPTAKASGRAAMVAMACDPLSSQPNLLATGDADGEVVLWDVRAKAAVRIIPHAHGAGVRSLCLAKGAMCLYTGGCKDDPSLKEWDLTSGGGARLIGCHRPDSWVLQLAVTPDKQHLVSAAKDHPAVCVWSLTASEPAAASVSPGKGPKTSLQSPGKGAAEVKEPSGSNSSFAFFDDDEEDDGEGRGVWSAIAASNEKEQDGWGTSLAISKDGSRVVTSGSDRSLHVWSLDDLGSTRDRCDARLQRRAERLKRKKDAEREAMESQQQADATSAEDKSTAGGGRSGSGTQRGRQSNEHRSGLRARCAGVVPTCRVTRGSSGT